ncbi:MAG: hypothetical protein IIA92_02315 [Chloroflexi bacterium]|nr:hypothetical protein [Chloroflexota bacterium]
MAKTNNHKNGHPNFLHLSEVLHHVEEGVVAAYDWLSGPPMSEKQRTEQRLAETAPLRRTIGF